MRETETKPEKYSNFSSSGISKHRICLNIPTTYVYNSYITNVPRKAGKIKYFPRENGKNLRKNLTLGRTYGIVVRQDTFQVFFLCLKGICMIGTRRIRTLAEVELCVQRLHWLVRNASSGITIPQRKRKTILTEWKSRSIVDSARLTHCTKKQNNGF